jgi:hypothetical protein
MHKVSQLRRPTLAFLMCKPKNQYGTYILFITAKGKIELPGLMQPQADK